VRLFLAINPLPDVRRAVIEATSQLRDAAPGLAWVDEPRLHLTLKFLGEQPETAVAPLADALDRVAARHRAFAVEVEEVGAFPNFRRARVVWMGVHREPRLELLHHDVEVACEQLGFALEGRAFRPHLTLARVRDRATEPELRALSRASRRITFAATTEVRSIDLMQSVAGSGGSRYECLHASTLRTS
jgi:RNA 2',3'-cyclic 3'-phosphodiesterase